ncbi:Homoserine dehydrogenase [bioreactor metagenome]|jgi:Homoserine dehydrogenase|uniref:Homoserine dehydrogenase n=1 Tax=bioreactor metagenome TaxID=1076179 RepID=A0A644TJ86_9ZZZZ|nr:homoserine dehydrogenase [Acidaminococcaceae bacterium]NLU45004.1 homoserine dehydrogenase [Acholeplasmataceae bacterium]
MHNEVKIGLLGAGTVGGGVILVLKNNAKEIEKRVGVPVRIVKVFTRSPEKVTELDAGLVVTNNVDDILDDPEIDIVIELIGREDPAKEYIARALANKKNVVTANKDILAKYGKELFALAEENNVDFMFEAAVAGGIPIIRPLKSCLAANKINSIMGIVNGTTNYMLSKMASSHVDFNEVLKEAQDLGYAESDPTADIGGLDAARKLVILASIAFNTRITLDDVYIEGIEKLTLRDIEYADELGYVVKLLAIAKNSKTNGISVRVHPTMLPKIHPLSTVNDVYNAIYVNGDVVGDAMFLGRGAGRMPTASAVCGDVVDVARNIVHNCTGRINCTCYEEKHLCSIENITSPCYVRLLVLDKPGVLAAIASAFGAQNVSLKNVVQKSQVDGFSELVVITYDVSEYNLRMALATLAGLPVVEKICSVIRVEDESLE